MRSEGEARVIIGVKKRPFEARPRISAFFPAILDSIAEPITFIGLGFRLELLNGAARKLMKGETGRPLTCYRCLHGRKDPCQGHEEEGPCPFVTAQLTGNPVTVVHRHFTPAGQTRYHEILASPLLDQEGRFLGIVEALRDVTDRRLREQERERLIAGLREVLEHVKTLRGLVPMCAWCKKIRDDRGRWRKVEDYIEEHTDAKFTHGMCPDCLGRELNENGTNE